MRSKRHQNLIKDYEEQKRKHLEKLATKMLFQDEKFNKLKEKLDISNDKMLNILNDENKK
jgi:hypothetical protein